MLDLNLDIISSCDNYETKNCKNLSSTREKIKKQMVLMEEDDSGTSNSSIIINNYTDDQQAVETDSAFIFDIMNKQIKDDDDNLMITTHQLFPEKTTTHEFIMESESKPPRFEWLKLSQMEPTGGEAELKIVQQKQQQIRKCRRGPRSRSSQYRGVTFYRRTGRWESHIWDCGKQVYLGGFDTALAAARAHDRAAIKFRGVEADINFSLTDYEDDMKQMRNLNKEEFVQILRRRSTGFARDNSKYRGLTLPKSGRIGQFHGNREAAVTTFDPIVYQGLIYNPNNDGGEGHNLELSLGNSMAVKKNNHKNVKSPNFELPNKERIKMVEHKHLNTLFNLPTLPFGLLQTKQERGTDMKEEANCLPKASSWEWQINNAKNNFVTLSHRSAAASSGFASSSTQQPFQRCN